MSQQEKEDILQLYTQYLVSTGCDSIHLLNNKFARVDALLTSGGTEFPLEYKNRYNDVYFYSGNSVLVEEKKIKSIINTANMIGAKKNGNSTGLYINEYTECYLIWEVTSSNNYIFKSEMHDNNNVDKVKVPKDVTYLPYSGATIISKNSGRRPWPILEEYINRHKSN